MYFASIVCFYIIWKSNLIPLDASGFILFAKVVSKMLCGIFLA